MNGLRNIVAAALLLTLPSCRKKTKAQLGYEEFVAMQAAYCTNTLRNVERLELDYLNDISRKEAAHVTGLDFDILRAEAHERLFLIYRKTGETNLMKFHFEKALENLSSFNRRENLINSNFTYESLAAAVERSESNLDVRWKKE